MEPEGALPHSQVSATCPYLEPDKSSPCRLPSHFLKIYHNIFLPSTPGSSRFFLSLTFPHQNPVYTSPLIPATCPAHLILLDLITRTILGKEYRLLSFLLCSFLHSSLTSSPLGPNIPLNTLFSNTLSLRSSLNLSHHVSHPYTTRGKLIHLCFLNFVFLIAKCKTKYSAPKDNKHYLTLICP